MNGLATMSASSSFSICRTTNPRFSRVVKVQLPAAQARSQSFRDEGNYSHTVDANMSVLRCRMEQVRMKERVDTCHNHGWNYRSPYDVVQEKNKMVVMSSIIQLACIVATTVGLVFLCGSICIFLVALILNRLI
ncbi:hypothetical protein ACP275_05G040100 [Erythranthe tilingii]